MFVECVAWNRSQRLKLLVEFLTIVLYHCPLQYPPLLLEDRGAQWSVQIDQQLRLCFVEAVPRSMQ